MKNNILKKISLLKILLLCVLCIYTIVLLLPFIWGLITSLKNQYEYYVNTLSFFPKKIMFSNYVTVFDNFYVPANPSMGIMRNIYFEDMIFNSVFYVLTCAFAATATPMITAYAVHKLPKHFISRTIYLIVIITMILPIVGSLPSEIQMARALGINRLSMMWFFKASFLGVNFLIFNAAFNTMPKDFAESAFTEGATNFQVLRLIAIPMVKTTFAIIFLLNCIGFWNDYMTPLLYLPKNPTLALGLFMFSGSKETAVSTVPMKLTGCFLMTLPILILFLIFRNKLIGNISLGGLKE